jgi:hypothetical protein
MSKIQRSLYILCVLVLIDCLPSFAQVATGTPPFGSFGGGPDIINLANLNSHLTIPIVQKAGRGTNFTYYLNIDSSVWYPAGTSGSQSWQPNVLPGQFGSSAGYTTHSTVAVQCANPAYPPTLPKTLHGVESTNYIYHDLYGVSHAFSIIFENDLCGDTGTQVGVATDGSGYTLTVSGAGAVSVTARNGKLLNPTSASGTGAASSTDRNGNEITESSSGVITDTLGTTALTIAGSSPTTFTYTAPNGQNVSYTANYTQLTVKTNFGCSGITEFGPTSENLLTSITLPDGTQYQFTYEATPGFSGDYTGRLASITLPTGGTISYTYSGANNGIECSDGSAAGLTRTVNPGGEWTYSRSGSGNAWTTTVTDPNSNQTVINFQSMTPAGGPPMAFYETERQIYQGSTSGTLLKTIFTCYNGSAPNCNSTAVTQPISQRSVYVQWPGTGGLESRKDTFYNSYGSLTEKNEYAYGAGAPGSIARRTVIIYASLGNGIVSMPASVTVEDGSSNVKSQTTYTYDQGTVTATSGTPQHVAVSGSRGNATTVAYLVQGSTTLSKTYTFYDTGNVNAATDVNGAVTTYTYGSGTSCGNSFATSVSEPLSLSRSMVWNCTGGVQTSFTDENGQSTTSTYNDTYFWRPNKVTDAASNIANFTYDGAVSVEGSVVFGSSTTDALTTVDSLGRAHISQLRESPT